MFVKNSNKFVSHATSDLHHATKHSAASFIMINDFMIHVLNRIDLSANFFGTLPLKLKNMPSHKLSDTVNCLATV